MRAWMLDLEPSSTLVELLREQHRALGIRDSRYHATGR